MTAYELRTINRIQRAAEALKDLIETAQPRGPLSDLPRKRTAHVSRTAKWCLRAIGNMIHDSERLNAVLAEWAIEPEPTDAELDARAEEMERERKAKNSHS